MGDSFGGILLTVLLVIGTAFFVAAEYSIVSSRRTKVETLAKKGSQRAKALLEILEDVSPAVAACQIGITIFSIALGSLGEPILSRLIESALGQQIDRRVGGGFAFFLVTFVVVVFGELVPKYFSLAKTEKVALAVVPLLKVCIAVFKPLILLAQKTAKIFLKPLGIVPGEDKSGSISRYELLMLVQEGESEGTFDKGHAEFVSRALRLDNLVARDLMIHRLDISWVDVDATAEELLQELKEIHHNRIPVCRGDIDDLVGILYLHDVVKALPLGEKPVESLLRPAVMVPENLTIDKVVQTMREQKTQILIVSDEYGGTSGLLTLEDVVEEVFGDLEDRFESERPPILINKNRVVARAGVRYDELLSFLNLDPGEDPITDTLATMVTEQLERVPRLGDKIDTPIGTLRVDNMARRRITRVSIVLTEGLAPEADPTEK